MLWFLTGALAAVLLFYALTRRLKHNADDINRYYLAALSAWLLYDDDTARLAALTVVKVAAGAQRESMIAAFERITTSLATEAGMDKDLMRERTRRFISDVGGSDWPLKEVTRAKIELARIDREYANALDRADPTVFSRRFPGLKIVGRKPS